MKYVLAAVPRHVHILFLSLHMVKKKDEEKMCGMTQYVSKYVNFPLSLLYCFFSDLHDDFKLSPLGV